jgi:hypothetical protein
VRQHDAAAVHRSVPRPAIRPVEPKCKTGPKASEHTCSSRGVLLLAALWFKPSRPPGATAT